MISSQAELTPFAYDAMTNASPEVVADILQAVHGAYQATIEAPGARCVNMAYGDVKSSPSCLTVASQISERLEHLDRGYEADTLGTRFDGTAHIVSRIKAPNETDEPIIIDATWQQFLSRRNLSHFRKFKNIFIPETRPDVFIGTPREVGRMALTLGFSQSQSSAWTDLRESA